LSVHFSVISTQLRNLLEVTNFYHFDSTEKSSWGDKSVCVTQHSL